MNTIKSAAYVAGAIAVVAALCYTLGADRVTADEDGRSQSVVWTTDLELGLPVMRTTVTTDNPADARVVTTITKTSDSSLVQQMDNGTATMAEMGETGPPAIADEINLSLSAYSSGTNFTVTSQFYAPDNTLQTVKSMNWTKP